jgi:hypothetical protein
MIEALIRDGSVALVAMAIIASEIAFVAVFARRRLAAFAANGLSGIGLLAALHVALVDGPPIAVAACLALAFAAHIANILLDRRSARPPPIAKSSVESFGPPGFQRN